MTHICISKLTIIGSDNGLTPARRQAIIWTNAGILLIGRLGTNFSEILIGIQIFSFTKNTRENLVCEMASILSQPQCVKETPKVHVTGTLWGESSGQWWIPCTKGQKCHVMTTSWSLGNAHYHVINSLRAKFFRGNINMYLHFMSFFHTDMPKIIEILPRIRPGLTYFTYSISLLLMS